MIGVEPEQESLEIGTRWGRLLAKGGLTAMVALVATMTLALAALGYVHDRRDAENTERILANMRTMLDSDERLRAALLEVTYVLTLDQERREALKLDMPDSLRQRIRQQ